MSHTVSFVTLNISQDIKNQCSDVLQRLNRIEQYDWKDENIKNKIEQLINTYTNKVNEILKQDHQIIRTVEWQQKLATITKDVANMQAFCNENIAQFYKTYLQNTSNNIEKIIAQYGSLATMAIEKIHSNHQLLNEQTLLDTIDQIRNEQLTANNLKIYHQEFQKQLATCAFPEKIKLELLNLVNTFTTAQEVSDIPGFIATKNEEFLRLVRLIKDMVNILKEVKFSFINKPIEYVYHTEDEGYFSTTLSFKNANNNTIVISFNSLGKINYKLGNYIGHACEATSRSILEKLKQKGYEYTTPIITRNISNAKPLAKAIDVFNERNK